MTSFLNQILSGSTVDGTFLWQFVPYGDPNDDYYVIFNKANKKAIYFHGEQSDWYNLYTDVNSNCSLTRKFKIVDDISGTGCNIVTADNALYIGIPSCEQSFTKALIQKPSDGTDCQIFAIEEMYRIFQEYLQYTLCCNIFCNR